MKVIDRDSCKPGLYKLTASVFITFFNDYSIVLSQGTMLFVISVCNNDGLFYYREYAVVSSHGCGIIKVSKDVLNPVF